MLNHGAAGLVRLAWTRPLWVSNMLIIGGSYFWRAIRWIPLRSTAREIAVLIGGIVHLAGYAGLHPLGLDFVSLMMAVAFVVRVLDFLRQLPLRLGFLDEAESRL